MKLWSLKCKGNQKDASSVSGKKEFRILTFYDLIAIGIGSTLGIGFSVLSGELIRNQTGPAIVVSVFVAGITALLGGLCFAEFGTWFMKVDSVYSYSYFCCKESAAFIFGLAVILELAAGTASVVKGLVTFIDALTEGRVSNFLKNNASTNCGDVFPYFDFISLIIIIIITVITTFKKKDSIFVKKLLTLTNLFLIIFVIIAGIFKADFKNWTTGENSDEKIKISFVPFGLSGIIKGAAVAFYGFIGFDLICVAGPEVKKRKRNLPIAIFATILVTFVSYASIGIILTFMMPYNKLNVHAAVAFAFEQVGWIEFKWIAVVATFFGFQTSFLGIIYPLFRIIKGMANDGLLFHCLGDSSSTSKAPVKASMIGGLIAAIAAGILPFQKLVNLTVIAALFVHSIMAINVIFFRYSGKLDDQKFFGCNKSLINNNTRVSVRAIMRNFFNFKESHPTVLTQNIILANVILFCISSIGLIVILNIFYDSLIICAAEVVIPESILLCVLLFTLISMTCQPKCQRILHFKVPLLPLVPCLSIFLNICLMMTFESLTWILFLSWMAIGTLFHFIWRFLKCLRKGVVENSMYEINRINAMKLNESIWKIKSDKKSFYEGTVNFAFSDDSEENSNEVKVDSELEARTNSKKTLQLNQAEIIQTCESGAENNTKPLYFKEELNFFQVNSAEILNELPDEKKQVHWECVAEIHTEDEFSRESVALEIVDNTYNFLSDISEELPKDNSFKDGTQEVTVFQDEFRILENIGNIEKPESMSSFNSNLLELTEKHKEQNNQHYITENEIIVKNKNYEEVKLEREDSDSNESLKQVLEENIKENLNITVIDNVLTRKSESENSNAPFGKIKEQEELFVNLIVKTIYEAHKSELILNQNNTLTDASDTKPTKLNSDEHNKKKEFKERLNQLLKNQLNNNATLIRSFSPSKPVLNEANKPIMEDEKSKDELYNTIRTLNKSQIRGKLEFLLAKGPPKRLSIESSFNLNVKEAVKENDLEKTEKEVLRENNNNVMNVSGGESMFEKASIVLPSSIREKILSLKKVEDEMNDDICC